MAATLRVPTIFTAIDKISNVVSKMGRGITNFANKAEAGIARGNRMFRRLTPTLSEASKELFSFAKSAAIAGAIVGGVVFSYQSLKDYETAVASFRTIVSDLNDSAFKPYQSMINQVAKDTKKSSIDVAASFEKIAGLNADFAKTAKGLGQVSNAAIILAKASKDDLGVSAENLVGIMNQFSLGADQANRVINVLAAGQAVGAASISQAAESYKNFGAVAKGGNVTLEQSVGLIQTLAKKSITGAEAGTALRGSILRLQKAGAGYKSGQFQINDALEQVNKKLKTLKTAKQRDALMTKIFGAENLTAGKILVDNIQTYKDFTKSVTGTNEAQKAAEINSNTLSVKLEELKNKWVNIITGSDASGKSMSFAKDAIGWVTDNLETLLPIGLKIVLFFAAWKAIMLGAQIAMAVYNIGLGIMGALTGVASVGIGSNSIALAAYTAASWIATTAASAFAFAVNLGLWPILLIVAAIAAVIAIFMNWDTIVAWFSKKWGEFTSWISSAWQSIVDAFSKFSFKDMFMSIGKSIIDFFLFPLRAVLSLASKIPGAIGKGAASALGTIDKITASIGVEDKTNSKPALSTPQMKSDEITRNSTEKNQLDVNINDKNNNVKSTSSKGKLLGNVKVSSTQGAR